MTALRSLLFNVFFYGWTSLCVIVGLPLLLGPRKGIYVLGRVWAHPILAALRLICGLKHQVRGRENLPEGPVLIAAKHQSAWDTLIWHQILDDPAIVMKRELLFIPIYGLLCLKTRMLAVDRRGGTAALKHLIAQARQAVADGRPIVIFPQGTRTAPGRPVDQAPYQPGVSALYRALDVPAVPVALNSGLFWPRRSFRRRPGTIVLEFLPPIAPGLTRRDFEAELRARIEPATTRLEATAGPLPATDRTADAAL